MRNEHKRKGVTTILTLTMMTNLVMWVYKVANRLPVPWWECITNAVIICTLCFLITVCNFIDE